MIVTFMAVAALSLAQTDSALLRELLQIENEIARANRECDYKYFAYIEAEEFIFTDASGGVTTRAQDLATEKDCRKADYRSEVDEPRLSRYGDVAILNARFSKRWPPVKWKFRLRCAPSNRPVNARIKWFACCANWATPMNTWR